MVQPLYLVELCLMPTELELDYELSAHIVEYVEGRKYLKRLCVATDR